MWLLLLLPVALLGCSAEEQDVPAHLFGYWVATDSEYRGRFFEVTESGRVVFGQGEGQTQVGELESVAVTMLVDESERCKLVYSTEEGTKFKTVVKLTAEGTELVFENSERIHWVRESPTP